MGRDGRDVLLVVEEGSTEPKARMGEDMMVGRRRQRRGAAAAAVVEEAMVEGRRPVGRQGLDGNGAAVT